MRTMKTSLIGVAVLATTIFAQSDPPGPDPEGPVWELGFQQGIQCSGSPTGSNDGPEVYGDYYQCLAIPAIGVTSAVAFRSRSTLYYEYRLGLHNTEDCSDAGGTYQGPVDDSICISVTDFTYYSIRTSVNVGPTIDSSTSDTALELHESQADLGDVKNLATDSLVVADLESRQNDNVIRAVLELGVIELAVQWWRTTAQVCPLRAEDYTPNRAVECGVDAVAALIYSAMAFYAIRGLFSRVQGPAPGGARMMKRAKFQAMVAEIDAKLPKNDETLIAGVMTSMTFTEPVFSSDGGEDDAFVMSEGSHWPQLKIEQVDPTTGHAYTSYADSEVYTNKTVMSSTFTPPAPAGGSAKFRRQNTDYTVFYSFDDMDEGFWRYMAKDADSLRSYANDIYNYGQNTDNDIFCASFVIYPAGDVKIYVNRGQFAILSGSFTEDVDSCPGPQ